MGSKLLGYIFLGVAIIVLGMVLYRNSNRSDVPLVFSPTQMLNSTWVAYKANYLEADTGRTLDKQRENITTSEGESYTMLRAVWLGDKETFDTSWQWTKDNLQHESGDYLFAWLFGKKDDGSYGILTDQGGNTTASDADTDIALALLFAYARWQEPVYLSDAKRVINDIWEKEVILVAGTPYLAANNLEKTSPSTHAVVNPSYLHPAAYKIFAQVDPTHPWNELADSSYALLAKASVSALDKPQSASIPPDWIRVDKQTGELSAPTGTATTNFGYDAMRTPWRLSLDWQWFKDPRAKAILDSFSFFGNQWQENQKISAVYAHNGEVIENGESPAIYGGILGYFMAYDSEVAKEIYLTKLQYLYDPGANRWKDTLSYYDDNWAWFGIGLYNNLLPNLTTNIL